MKNRRLDAAATALAVILCASVTAQDCTSPANETCDDAIVFTSADLPYSVSDLLGCANNVPDKPYWDVFYRFDCTTTADYTLDMCDSDGDTYVRVYANGCGWSDGDEFAVNDDGCPGSPPNADPMLTVTLKAGQSYWIELGTWRPDPPWGDPNLPYNFTMVLEPAPCPADTDGDGSVGTPDLLALLAAWGTSNPTYDITPDPPDGTVNTQDLLALLAAWGPCP